MRRYRLGSHARYDLKVHLVWVPKYRKRVLTGAVRARDLLRQIAAENDLQIISGKVAADHVHLFLSYRAHQNISQIVQWLKGTSSRSSSRSFRTSSASSGVGTSGHAATLRSPPGRSPMR
jgi:putative transposase